MKTKAIITGTTGIKKSYMFRPAFMKATSGQKNVKTYYKFFAWLYPLGRTFYPAGFCTLQEVGRAMINAVIQGYSKPNFRSEGHCKTGSSLRRNE